MWPARQTGGNDRISGLAWEDDAGAKIEPRIEFLGTGASGGTPGKGRSDRTENSALVRNDDTVLLVDVAGDFEDQASRLDAGIDAILLTYGHSDAVGGFAALRR